MLLLRDCRAEDAPSLRDLLVETWHATYDPILGPERVAEITDVWHAVERLRGEASQPGVVNLLAEREGALVGTAQLRLTEEEALLGRLYVRPSEQGQGIGRALLDAALARAPGARLVRLEVEPQNEAAIRFYERQGFARRERQASCGGREDLSAIIMEKPLAPARAHLIRPVSDGDAQDLFGLLSLCFAEYPGCFVDPHGDLPDLKAPASAFAANGGAFWAVEDGRGRVGACAAVEYPEPGVAELHRLYVRPDLRRQGLGVRLIGLVEAHARARGVTRLFFWSDTRFADAHRLYDRLGYARTGGPRELGDISGSQEWLFEKAL